MRSRDSYSVLLIRLGLGTVFMLFGYDKLPHPESWIIYYPPQFSRLVPLPPIECLKLQGIGETLLGAALILGFMTRLSACLAAVMLTLIIYFVGWDPVAIRDGGLLFAVLSLVLSGGGPWSVDAFLTRIEKP